MKLAVMVSAENILAREFVDWLNSQGQQAEICYGFA